MRTFAFPAEEHLRRTSRLLPIALLLSGPPLAAQEPERFTLEGDDVAIYDLAGSVSLVAGTGSDVQVEVRRGGADAAELGVVTDEIDGRNALRVMYPDDEIVYPAMGRGFRVRLEVDDDGTFGDHDGRGWLALIFGFDSVTIRGSGNGLEAHADLRIEVPAGRRVAVYLGAGEVAASNVEGELQIEAFAGRIGAEATRGSLQLDTGSGDIQVTDATGDLDADTGSGSITVRGASGGSVRLDTGSGHVAASDIDASDILVDTGSGSVELDGITGRALDADTGSGTVSARSVLVDDVRIDTGSGSIIVEGTSARTVDLDTGSGRIEIGLMSDVERLTAETGSGSVVLRVPSDLGAEIEIDTGSGAIDLGVPVQATRIDRSYLLGRIGDGGGRISIETGSGDVRLASF